MAKQPKNMIKYIIKRVLMMIPMLVLVLTLSWLLSYLMVQQNLVNPVAGRLGATLDPDIIEAELRRIGYYDPWYVQLAIYFKNFFTGNWGVSYNIIRDKPVIELISEIFPRTIELMLIPIILSPIIAVKLGIASATHKDKLKDVGVRTIAILGAGFPIFWIADMVQRFFGYYVSNFSYEGFDIPAFFANTPGLEGPPIISLAPPLYSLLFFCALILLIFGILLLFKGTKKFKQTDSSRNKNLLYIGIASALIIFSIDQIINLSNWFYTYSYGTGFRIIDSIIYNDQIYLWDTFIHLILPAICITLVSLASMTRQTRSSMLDVLNQDYIRTARAKGVLEHDVINKHAIRNALLPVSNLIVGGTATALLGSFFIEITFNYKGYGYYMVISILVGDYLVTLGLLVFATIIILSGTLIADVLYTIIDPRITYQ
ncbi:MAG: ABC transporter permease [Candidatus Hermodarchaeota archaeon]